ncbi:MAG TPA: hypothetical protein VG713_06070 [Pirellulales bacterium]|jgi:hypothetical protein|nr:hypothetical protein [Pirellulales bacterium]
MIDITPGGIEVALLGAVGGVATYFFNQFVVEWYHLVMRRRRLRDALLVDCVEILHRVNHLSFQYHRIADADDRDDLRQVMKHPNGFVMCGPMPDTRELVTLLDQRGSRLVVRFFERWETFAILEHRYTAIYQKLLETAAACLDRRDDVVSLRELKLEYWEQLRAGLLAMQETGKDLCFFACQLFRHLGKFNEPLLAKYSAQRWTSWSEFDAEVRRYADGVVDPLIRVGSTPHAPHQGFHGERRRRDRTSAPRT